MYVADTVIGWLSRKILFIHDTPYGCFELRNASNEDDVASNVVTYQCQNNAYLSFQNPESLQHRLVRSFAQRASLDD